MRNGGKTIAKLAGLLLGSVHGTHMLIGQATVPTAWDKRFRYLFERMPYGHEAIALADGGQVKAPFVIWESGTHIPKTILILPAWIERNGIAWQRSVVTSDQCWV